MDDRPPVPPMTDTALLTADEKLLELIVRAGGQSCDANGIIAALRAAGWLLIPPLDTEEGRQAMERADRAFWGDNSSWTQCVHDALLAAGGSLE